MNILMISHDFWPNVGGIANHVYNLSLALRSLGHKVTVLSVRPIRSEIRKTHENIKVLRIPILNIRKVRGLIFSLLGIGAIAGKKFDVIHWHNLLPDSLIASFGNSKVKVFTNHTSQFIEMTKSGKGLGLARWLIRKADVIIGPSPELAELSNKFLHKPAYYVPNGVDTRVYMPYDMSLRQSIRCKILQRLGFDPDSLVILCPRRLEPKNGVHYLIEAVPKILASHPNIVVLIAGNDADKRYARMVRRLATTLGVQQKVVFMGPIPPHEMVHVYNISDIVVIPSLLEAVSIAALEASACGLPVVASNVGGLPEVVLHGETGLLFEPGDTETLANHIKFLLDNDRMRHELGKRGRERVTKVFSWDKVAKNTLQIYESILSSKRN